ncbi:MAG: hypothetical protein KAI47_11930, partial [Deltaproteobacteria bacterium]|nr:hypothetical protein [Deltaproteobacteria bacterium]
MTHKTRVIELLNGQDRHQVQNGNTMGYVGASFDVPEISQSIFKTAFIKHYKKIRRIVEGYKRHGVAMIAIEGSKLVASACLGAKHKRINVAIVGRHSVADLFLPENDSLSLRHLAVILYPEQRRDEPRVRVIDLRTFTAFSDERGIRNAALEAEGPLFLTVGRYLLMLFPTGEETPWPDDPTAGWECIPERVYLDDVPAEPDRWQRHRIHGAARDDEPTVAPRQVVAQDAKPPDDASAAKVSPSEASPSKKASPSEAASQGIQGGLHPVATNVADAARLEQRRAARGSEDDPDDDEKDDPKNNDPVDDDDPREPPNHNVTIAGEIDTDNPGRDDAIRRPVAMNSLLRHRTLVQSFSGPSRARRSLLRDHERPLGALRIRSPEGLSTILIGAQAASEGALFGRYERCDNEGLTVLSNGNISRVHMLLIAIDDQLYVVDTASTNGIR